MIDDNIELHIPGYKIIRSIGHGGMATVYLALQESIEREVAIKVMSPALASDPSFSERFVKEARMANLSHSNIITVYDAGVADQQNYIVMELAVGGNLDSAIQNGLSAERIIEIIKQISSALHYSCNKGFIHRDVKPENILFKENGSALLVDFGIAKAVSSSTRLTMVGSTIGSPNYMSPEQARGLALDGRSDLYALGIVFYEALTGLKPFDASDTYVIGLKHISDPIPQLPKPFTKFQTIIDQLLAKEPNGRFENGTELNTALDKIPLDAIDATVVPVSDLTYDDTKTHADIKERDTKISPEFGERETLIVGATNEPTQVFSEKADDLTRIVPVDETVVVPVKKGIVSQEKKSNRGLLWIVVSGLILMGGFYAWKMIETLPPAVVIDDPVINSEVVKIKPEPIEAPTEPVEDDNIQDYLDKAALYLSKKQLTTPKNKNAYFMYQKVFDLEPDNRVALSGLVSIGDVYYDFAKKKVDKKQYKKADVFIDKGLDVIPTHEKLLALQTEIDSILEANKRVVIAKPQLKPEHVTFKKDSAVLNLIGRHRADTSNEAERSSRVNLNNKIYYLGLKQCNNNNELFERLECQTLYRNLIQQWPIAIKTNAYTEVESNKLKYGKFVFNQQKAIQEYKAGLNNLESSKLDLSNKMTRVKIANRLMISPVSMLLGIEEKGSLVDLWNTSVYSMANKIKSIKDEALLVEKIKSLINGKRVFIKPFVSSQSFEITPFSSALYQTLNTKLPTTNRLDAAYQLRGEFELLKSGDLILNVWLFNEVDEILDLETFVLNASVFKKYRISNLFYNESIFPSEPLNFSYGFPADIKIGDTSSNALLLVGDETSLSVKMDNAGFFFIAVHVVRQNEQFSYLLPLQQSKVPFVQVALHKQKYQYASLGNFDITAPTGVETLQLIASSINLEKYLPPYTWSEKRQQFIINGSEGSIENGISAVRRMSNRIHQTAHDKTVQWQERLLVTTILEKQEL